MKNKTCENAVENGRNGLAEGGPKKSPSTTNIGEIQADEKPGAKTPQAIKQRPIFGMH